MAGLDNTDRKLLALLQRDASLSYADLGQQVKLSVSAVNERVRKLETKGILRAYTVTVDPRALDLSLLAFIQVSLNDPKYQAAFLTAVAESPSILECHTVTGGHSYLLKARCRDPEHLQDLLAATIKATPGITRTETMVVLSTVKETAILSCGG